MERETSMEYWNYQSMHLERVTEDEITDFLGLLNTSEWYLRDWFVRIPISVSILSVFIDYALNDRRKPPEQVEAAWRAMAAAWRAEMAKGTPQDQLLSQANHPNRRCHEVAVEATCEILSLEISKP